MPFLDNESIDIQNVPDVDDIRIFHMNSVRVKMLVFSNSYNHEERFKDLATSKDRFLEMGRVGREFYRRYREHNELPGNLDDARLCLRHFMNLKRQEYGSHEGRDDFIAELVRCIRRFVGNRTTTKTTEQPPVPSR